MDNLMQKVHAAMNQPTRQADIYLQDELSVLGILLNQKCPNCGEVHATYPWYIKAEVEIAGIFCPSCKQHFYDDGSCEFYFIPEQFAGRNTRPLPSDIVDESDRG